jgi:hypothetical protein
VIKFATLAGPKASPTVPLRCTLLSKEFRRAYHHALDFANTAPAVQRVAARSVLERYFSLEVIAPDAALNRGSFYFTERPINVHGKYKFLLPGTIKRELVDGPLFLLRRKTDSVDRFVDAKEFDCAVSSVEAVRLTLMPERVNGILSFISDGKKFYAADDVAGAERAIGTALDHLNRAASEGLRRIKTDAEKGKRANEVAGTRRTLANLRRKLQSKHPGSAEARPA